MDDPVTTTDQHSAEPPSRTAEESISLFREHREEMTLWLALEVLQLSPVTREDPDLTARLILLQDRLEERLRAKTRPNT